jgi:AcrR family transcriptional regulator
MSEPIQSRARQTEGLVLDTAEELLRSRDVEACTMPEVAQLSGRSIGAIYRRFPDKNALMEKVFRRYFERLRQHNSSSFERLHASGASLKDLVRMIVRGIVVGQRRDRRLIAALRAFARDHPDKAFRHESRKLQGEVFARLRELLLARRREFTHPDPERAVDMALATISLTTQALTVHDELSPVTKIDDETLAAELTRMTLAYFSDDALRDHLGA